MKTKLLVVGKTNDKNITKGIDDYVGRVKHYMPFDIEVIPELKNTKSLTQSNQKEMEAEQILKRLQPSDTVVLLDEHGKEYRSIEFARWIEKLQQTARSLVFIIGGLRIREKRRQAVALKNDFLTPDDTPALRGADIQGVHNHKRRTVSSRMKTIKHECLSPLRLFRRTNTRKC